MMIQSIASSRFGGRHTACGAAILTALFGLLPLRSFGDQPPAADTVSHAAEVSLSDLARRSAPQPPRGVSPVVSERAATKS